MRGLFKNELLDRFPNERCSQKLKQEIHFLQNKLTVSGHSSWRTNKKVLVADGQLTVSDVTTLS